MNFNLSNSPLLPHGVKAVNPLTRRIESAVNKARQNEKWRSEYMKEWILFDDARTEGIQQGREEGRRQERLDGVRGFILDKLEDNTDKETILSKLQKVFSITRKEAEEYWNQIVQ